MAGDDGRIDGRVPVRLTKDQAERLARAMVVADDEGLALDEPTAVALVEAIRTIDPEWVAPWWAHRLPGFEQDDEEGNAE